MPQPAESYDPLLTAVNENPADQHAVFKLAESYYEAGDFTSARFWYARRATMDGSDNEEVFTSLLRLAESMHRLGQPWPEVQEAYLRAWEYRPSRAEPLYYVAKAHRQADDYLLGYLFAERAAQIPLPSDKLHVARNVYNWAALDEQGICASWIGKKPESFAIFRQILSRPDVPTEDRARLAGYCEYLTPDMIAMASSYPVEVIRQLGAASDRTQDRTAANSVTVAFAANYDRAATERTLNTFLNCCTDISAVHRFLLVDVGLSEHDRTALLEAYPFLELADRNEEAGRFLLRLESGWVFFSPEPLIRRLTSVFEVEPNLAKVGLNFADVRAASNAIPAVTAIRYTPNGDRFIQASAPTGPAMVDTTRLGNPEATYATLDEIFCVVTPTS